MGGASSGKNPLAGQRISIALRDDPDVILIGEMRDYETISLANDGSRNGTPGIRHAAHSSAALTIDPHYRRLAHSRAGQVRNQLFKYASGHYRAEPRSAL